MGAILSIFSNVLYVSEKVTLYLTCTSLISCLVLMFIVTLGMGVGLGYNYCYVDMKTKVKYVPGHYQYRGSPRWPYLREGGPDSVAVKDIEDAEDASLRRRLTVPPDNSSFEGPTPPNSSLPLVEYTIISLPDYKDDDDFTVAPSNKTVANSTSENIKEAEETTTMESTETEDGSEATFPSSEDSRSVHEPDMINEIEEPTPEAPASKNDPNNRRVKKLVIPISGLDLISLLSKLKAENKNYSLQIVTT